MIRLLQTLPTEEITQAAQNTIESVTTTAQTATSEAMGFGELFLAGGWLMWPLLLLGGLVIFIFVERFIAIRKATRIDQNFMNKLRDLICDGNVEAALRLCKKTDTPIARYIHPNGV